MQAAAQDYSGQKQSPTAAAVGPFHMQQLMSSSASHHTAQQQQQLFQPQMFQHPQAQQTGVQCLTAAAATPSPPVHTYTQQLSSQSISLVFVL